MKETDIFSQMTSQQQPTQFFRIGVHAINSPEVTKSSRIQILPVIQNTLQNQIFSDRFEYFKL